MLIYSTRQTLVGSSGFIDSRSLSFIKVAYLGVSDLPFDTSDYIELRYVVFHPHEENVHNVDT